MTEEEYNSLVDMFESDGWTIYIKQVEETEDAYTKGAVDGAPNNDQWQWLRGWLTNARNTLGYETFVRLSYEEQAKEDAGYADGEEEGDTYDATL